ncbi:TolC family protein [Candidatus Methylocalor cossyra]|uniref:TolC family protein n=1 Tax=Candidatus Methylocalor cossyra TaxID=3108543 RepID=UPI0032B13EB2
MSAIPLLIALQAGAAERPPSLDDPLAAYGNVPDTPGRAAVEAGWSDPCRKLHRARRTWSLLDIVDQALCHNPRTRQAWANARFQAAQLGVAEAAYLPTINLTTSVSETQNTSGGNIATPVISSGLLQGRNQAQTRIMPSLTLNYLLFDFGGRAARRENARLVLEAAQWSHAAALQSVLLATIQAYYQLFAARSAVAAAEAAERSAEEALKAATFRYQVGAAALADKLQAQTAYAQARLNRQQAVGTAQVALGTLANAMGLAPSDDLEIEPPPLSTPDLALEQGVQALIEEAKALRPDLAAAEAQVKAAEANVQSVKAAGLPTLSMIGNYTYLESSVFNSVQSWVVGVQLNVPLFTGFANTYQIRGAEEQVAIQRANRDQLDQSVALDVWRAYFNLNTARDALRSSEDLLASATQNEQAALGRYKAGAGSILEVLTAQANLANARFQQVQAQFNWHIGKAQLAQAIGRLDLSQVEASARAGKAVN